MHFPLLDEMMVLFALSSVVLLVCHRLRLPALIAFLVTGALVGPEGFGLVKAVKEVELLAELGIILLMFTIGLELSLARLFEARRAVLLGGGLQVGLSVLVSVLVSVGLGQSLSVSLLVGFLVALSSTAIVLKLFQDANQVDSIHGRSVLGILIFQDIVAIPMMLLIPELAGTGQGLELHPLTVLGYLVGIGLLTAAAARVLIPFLLDQVARTQSREVFLIAILAVCFSVATLTASMGLSLALGAFLAGLIVAESEYSHTATGYVLPFKELFSSFFFVSVGMLLNAGFVVSHVPLIGLVTLGLLLLKATLATLAAVVVGLPLRSALLAGLSLAQVGEFSFVLARSGESVGLITGDAYELFLAVSVFTMLLTPGLLALAPRLAQTCEAWRLPQWLRHGRLSLPEPEAVSLSGHLVIVGYGFNGQNVARAAASCGLPYTILELQPELVRRAHTEGQPIQYGDATQESVLEHVRVRDARVVVVALSDPAASRQVTAAVRRINPTVHLIVRTRTMRELDALYALGASEVIPEEYETSVEIFSRVLDEFLVPRDEIEQLISRIRMDGYGMFRTLSLATARPAETGAQGASGASSLLQDVLDIDKMTVRVKPSAQASGRTLGALNLRRASGVTLLIIRRGEETVLNPGAEEVVQAGDQLTLVGTAEQLAASRVLFE